MRCYMHLLMTQLAMTCMQGMQVQNMVWQPAIITIITSLASIPINMFFIGHYNFSGAALAKSASRTLQFLLFCGQSACPYDIL